MTHYVHSSSRRNMYIMKLASVANTALFKVCTDKLVLVARCSASTDEKQESYKSSARNSGYGI